MRSATLFAGLLACFAPSSATVMYQDAMSSLSFNMFTMMNNSNTDMYFNISIPSSHGWGAIGIGDQMVGALMFILLPDSTRGSVVSVRTANSHSMPTPITTVEVDTLSANMDNSVYSAQAVCRSCKWNDFSTASTSQSFVWAVGPGSSGVSGTGANAMIMQHSRMGTFTVDMTQATPVSSPSNPSSGGSSSGSGSSGSGIVSSSQTKKIPGMLLTAHAVLLPLSFIVIFPLAVITLRAPAIGSWKIHSAFTSLGAALSVAGMGVAIHMVRGTKFGDFKTAHQGIGLTAVSLVIIQWFLGLVHHLGFRKFQKRWIVSYLHLTIGPIAMTLGVINPILGFLLTGRRPSAIGVGVVGLLILVATFTFAWVVGGMSRKKNSTKEVKAESTGS